MSLSQIAKACGGTLSGDKNAKNLPIDSITTDSRQVKKGCLFIPLKGETFDGHDFIEKSYQNGAICCLSETLLSQVQYPYIKVDSCYQAIKDIAEYYRSLFTIPIIGITGSAGKTSTKEMIAAVLGRKYKVLKTQGNFNNELGVPLTLFGLEEEHEVAVVEMGISDFAEMTRLSKMVRPDICVITNIGDCHLENLVDRSGVLKAKTEMFTYRNKNGSIYLNGDDAYLKTIKDVEGTKPCFYGLDEGNSYWAQGIENKGIEGISCSLCFENKQIQATIPAIGTYMVSNALVAVAIGRELGLSEEDIAKGIRSYKTVGSRAGVIDNRLITIIDDCYNANPNSVKAAIDTVCNFTGRKLCILGDMKELGENAKALHKEVGEYAAQKQVNVLVAIGAEAKEIAQGAKADGSTRVHYFTDVFSAVEELENIVQKGDIILVKASRAMKFEQIVAALQDLTLENEEK